MLQTMRICVYIYTHISIYVCKYIYIYLYIYREMCIQDVRISGPFFNQESQNKTVIDWLEFRGPMSGN